MRRRAASSSCSPSSRSSGSPARWSGVSRRIDAGTVSRTSSSSEPAPAVASIWSTSSPGEPRWRRTKVSVGLRTAPPVSPLRSPRAAAPAAPGEPLSFSTLRVLLVLFGLHHDFQVVRGGESDLDQPAVAVGILVEQLGIVHHGVVDLDDLARDGREHFGHGLDRLDRAELVVGVEHLADLRQLHEHHLAQLLLRELGDPDHTEIVLDAEPLVLPRIEIIAWVHSSFGLHSSWLSDHDRIPIGPCDGRGSPPPPRGGPGHARRSPGPCPPPPSPAARRRAAAPSRTSGSRYRWSPRPPCHPPRQPCAPGARFPSPAPRSRPASGGPPGPSARPGRRGRGSPPCPSSPPTRGPPPRGSSSRRSRGRRGPSPPPGAGCRGRRGRRARRRRRAAAARPAAHPPAPGRARSRPPPYTRCARSAPAPRPPSLA